MKKKPSVAERYINLNSEDIWTSLIFNELRRLPPEFLRQIINRAVGREAILPEEVDPECCEIRLWERLDPPAERKPRSCMTEGSSFSFLKEVPKPPIEGQTEADVWIQLGSKLSGSRLDSMVLIEMKLHSPISTKTSHDPLRNQMLRNLEVLWVLGERLRARRLFCLLWDNQYLSDSIIRRMRNPEILKTFFSDRNCARYTFETMASNVGWINFQQVRTIVAGLAPQMRTRAERLAAYDLLWLLDDLLTRSVRQVELPFQESRKAEEGN